MLLVIPTRPHDFKTSNRLFQVQYYIFGSQSLRTDILQSLTAY